jgi:Protein of unknown function (DUF3093)
MLSYHERLRVPVSWWLAGTAVIILLGAELAAGLGWVAAAAVYPGLLGGYAALLTAWGRAGIEVTAGELRAGRGRLALASAGEVTELDDAQTRAIRGPRADPAAFLLMRPYLRRHVYIGVTGQAAPAPYWLVATRHPAELAAAINRSRPAARADGAPVG